MKTVRSGWNWKFGMQTAKVNGITKNTSDGYAADQTVSLYSETAA